MAVLRSFAATATPTAEDRARHAASMGLGLEQFRRLFLIWQGGASPADLDGAGAHKNLAITRRTGLPPETKAVVHDVIGALGTAARPVEIIAEVNRRCEAACVRAPSRSQIWNMLMAARRSATSSDARAPDETSVAIGTLWFKLPVVGRNLTRPEALLAVDEGSGVILAADVAIAPARPKLGDLLDRLDETRRAQAKDWLARHVGGDTDAIGPDQLPPHRISALVGDRIGGIGVYRQPERGVAPVRLARLKRDAALVGADAQQAIRHAIERHNAARVRR